MNEKRNVKLAEKAGEVNMKISKYGFIKNKPEYDLVGLATELRWCFNSSTREFFIYEGVKNDPHLYEKRYSRK